MPDPDPQPPKPRAVSPARWLLMLLPSLVMLVTIQFSDEWLGSNHGHDTSDKFFWAVVTAAVLSMLLGFALHNWRCPGIKDGGRALGDGYLVFIVNAILALAGCSAIVTYFLKK